MKVIKCESNCENVTKASYLENKDEDGNGSDLLASERTPDSPSIPELPEEIWLHIFGLLSDKDRGGVLSSCGTFYRYLNDTKQTFLFDGVFPIIERQLTWSDIFVLRLTCKSWKRAVDSYLLKNYRRPFNENNTKILENGKYFSAHPPSFPQKFLSGDITRFCWEMALHPVNPFPGGIFQAHFLQADDGMKKFSLVMTPFLSRFGIFISHLFLIDHTPAGYIPSFVCLRLRSLLCGMPHLKTFVFQITVAPSTVEDRFVVVTYVRDKALPRLPLLQVLDVNPVLVGQRLTPQIRASIQSLHLIQDKLVRRYGANLGQFGVASFLWKSYFLEEENLRLVTELKFHGICSKGKFATFVKEVESGLKIPELTKLDLKLLFDWQKDSKPKLTRFIQNLARQCAKLQVISVEDCYEHNIKFLVERKNAQILLSTI